MLKYEIHVDRAEKEKDETKVMRLALRIDGRDGAADLMIVDEDGKRLGSGLILSILPDGTLKRWMGVNWSAGLQLDNYGRIVEVE